MNDTELLALTALVNRETILIDGDNQFNLVNGNTPRYCDDYKSECEDKLITELYRRSILSQQEGKE